MSIPLPPLRTFCGKEEGEAIFQDFELEKEIRKNFGWWLPVALPCRVQDDRSLVDHRLPLSLDVALWLIELRHESDSDEIVTGYNLRGEGDDGTPDESGKLRDQVESELPDGIDTISNDSELSALSEQEIKRPDLSSADIVFDNKGVVLDHVKETSSVVVLLNAPLSEHPESTQDSVFESNTNSYPGVTDSVRESILDLTGDGIQLSGTLNPVYSADNVGGATRQCRGECNSEGEARFRKLCHSTELELGRTSNTELAAYSPEDCEVNYLECGISGSDKVSGSEGNNTANEQACESFEAESNLSSTFTNSDSLNSDLTEVLTLKCDSTTDALSFSCDSNVSELEPIYQSFYISSEDGVIVSAVNDRQSHSKRPDDVLHDLEYIMHILQGMEDEFSEINNKFVECQENQDVEFLLLCDNADNLVNETLQSYESHWMPSKKKKPVSEASSNFSDDVFLTAPPQIDEIDVFVNNSPVLDLKGHCFPNINYIFDDGTRPPIPPLRKKKKDKSNVVLDALPEKAVLVGINISHESESENLNISGDGVTLENNSSGGVSNDSNVLLIDNQLLSEDRTNSESETVDPCYNEQIIDLSSSERIIESVTCDEFLDMASTQKGDDDSQQYSPVVQVNIPQARPISSFVFPPCAMNETDDNVTSLGRELKQRLRPVTSLQDFNSNVFENSTSSYSSLDRNRKGSGSSDIAAWKKDLQRSGFFSQDDDEWFSSTDNEGRVYFFPENSVESSWTLPKISIDDSEISPNKPLSEVNDPLLRIKEGEKRGSSRISKARSLLVTDKKQRESSEKSSSIPKNFLLDQSPVLMEGPLNRTKITENGKKVRKNWVIGHVVLREQFLIFYKDTKSVQPELFVELNEAVLEAGDKMSKRKNVFLISTAGLQVLCQADDAQLACEWCLAINNALENLDKSSSKFLAPHSQDVEKNRSPLLRTKSVRSKCTDGSIEDASGNEEQTKIRNRLKRFFHLRPTRETLASKGIYKDEPVFDNHLGKVCSSEPPRIPKFVQLCIKVIEGKEENMKTDGLYRASGNLSHVQKIRLEVDQNNLQVLEKEEDVHVLTGALKLFFRELKEPLLPFELFSTALETGDLNSNRKANIRFFQSVVQQLPEPNRDTLSFLLRHLRKVTEFAEFNRMHVQNLAIVFGPTLIWREKECHQNMALEYMQQNLVIDFFLHHYDEIFKNFKLPNS